MSRISDELYEYEQDVREKAHTNRSARNRRGHNGKSGRVRFSTDYLTDRQLKAMNSEVTTYRLGAPMNWSDFNVMPNDLKIMYIKKLRLNYNVPDEALADAMGVDRVGFDKCIYSLGLAPHRATRKDGYNWYESDGHERFVSWWVIVED